MPHSAGSLLGWNILDVPPRSGSLVLAVGWKASVILHVPSCSLPGASLFSSLDPHCFVWKQMWTLNTPLKRLVPALAQCYFCPNCSLHSGVCTLSRLTGDLQLSPLSELSLEIVYYILVSGRIWKIANHNDIKLFSMFMFCLGSREQTSRCTGRIKNSNRKMRKTPCTQRSLEHAWVDFCK